jgi:hypothetical protein
MNGMHGFVRSLHFTAVPRRCTIAAESCNLERTMTDPVDALIVDLLESIGNGPRPYADVIEAWRTSCPRLPVWEEANARGFIVRLHEPGQPAQVGLSALGRAYRASRRAPADSVRARTGC